MALKDRISTNRIDFLKDENDNELFDHEQIMAEYRRFNIGLLGTTAQSL